MTERKQVYKCRTCGAVVEVLSAAPGVLVCCGEAMALCRENTVDASAEKHVPVTEPLKDCGMKVKVGAAPHPMDDDHYIEWIEVINGNYINRRYLKPGERPEADFYVSDNPNLIVRAYCNKHGLWKK